MFETSSPKNGVLNTKKISQAPTKTLTKTKVSISIATLAITMLATSTLLLGLFSGLAAISVWRIGAGNAFGYETHDMLGVGEYGTVYNLTHQWQTVDFLKNNDGAPRYDEAPVVIAKPVSRAGSDPSHIRIKNVTASSFQLKVEEWANKKPGVPNNGVHSARETVSFWVMPVGEYDFDGEPGSEVQAGIVEATDAWNKKDIDLAGLDTDRPIIFTQSQTRNGSDPIVTRNKFVFPELNIPLPPASQDITGECSESEIGDFRCIHFDENHGGPVNWTQECKYGVWFGYEACSNSCSDGVCLNPDIAVHVRVQEEEGCTKPETNTCDHASETVGYIAFVPISEVYTKEGYSPLIIDSGMIDGVTHKKWKTFTFGQTFDQAPALLMDMQTYNGSDTAGLRYRRLGTDSVQVFVEEEKSRDTETNHFAEMVGYIAFERPHIPIPQDAKISIATLKDIYVINEPIELTDPPESTETMYRQSNTDDYLINSGIDDYSIDYNKSEIKALPDEVKKKLQSLPTQRQTELNYELTSIKNDIEKKGDLWIAKFNSKSILDDKEKEKLCGLKGSPPETKKKSVDQSVADLPDFFDWRDQHGENYITPIKDQSSCGSCWAFATDAVLEGHVNTYYNNHNLNIDLSEQDLVSCYLGDGCSGANPSEIEEIFSTRWQNIGTTIESCFPYAASNVICEENRCTNWEEDAWRILGYENVSLTVNDIKRAVMENGPVEVGMVVYSDFFSYSGGIYSHTTGSIAGYHAVTIVGFGKDDGREYWIVKNSWGTDWGEDGYFKIMTGESDIDSWFAYAITQPNPPVNQPQAVICSDKDGDDYCSWGFSERPLLCDDEMEPLEEGFSCCPFRCLSNIEKDCDDNYYNDSTTINDSNCGKPIEVNGILSITSNPNDAEVYVKDLNRGNDVYRGNTSVEFELNAGEREIILKKIGYLDYERMVKIRDGLVENLFISLERDSQYQEGWPIDIDTGGSEFVGPLSVLGSLTPTLADIDEDGIQDIILHSTFREYAFNHNGTDMTGWPTPKPSGHYLTSGQVESAAVDDIDNDNEVEIMTVSYDSLSGYSPSFCFNVYNKEGEIKEGWPKMCNEDGIKEHAFIVAPTLSDLDGDGIIEIIVASEVADYYTDIRTPTKIHVFNPDGTYFMNWPYEIGHNYSFFNNLTIGIVDLDKDGYKEILALVFNFIEEEGGRTKEYYLFIWNYDGSLMDNYPIRLPLFDSFPGYYQTAEPRGGPIIADIDNDGEFEFGLFKRTFKPGLLIYLELDGSIVEGWPVSFDGQFLAPAVSVVDIDNDGTLETIFGTAKSGGIGGIVHVIKSNGLEMEGWPKEVEEGYVGSQATIGDVDGDNSPDVLVSTSGGSVYAWSKEGVLLEGFPKKMSGISKSGVAIGDIDGDLDVEIISCTNDGKVYVWDLDAPYNPETMQWPMFQHDPQHTGLYTSLLEPRPQSKIKNLDPEKDLEGNLFVYIEKYESEQWGSRMEVIEDYGISVSPNDQLGIDTIFNPLERGLSEVGVYQVCAELRDRSDSIIESIDGDLLEACWEFEVR